MAIISFWTGGEKPVGQTLAVTSVATYMAVERNYRILLINANYNDNTLERCFWKINEQNNLRKSINQGKLDIASGPEGLISAVASNKATPEIVPSFTKVLLKNRLDVLVGLKTEIYEDFEKTLMLYKDLINVANKYYDLVFVDLPKTLKRDTTKTLLKNSSLIMYCMPQNSKYIDQYIKERETEEILQKDIVVPILTCSDDESKYNSKNVSRYIGYKDDMLKVPYNAALKDSVGDGGVANYVLRTKLSKASLGQNLNFITSVNEICSKTIYKLQELQYRM